MTKDKNGKGQGCFTPVAVTYTKADGTQATWSGRGRRPSEVQAMFEAGTYVPPSVKAKDAAKSARVAKRAEKAAAKAVKTPAVTPVDAPTTV
jgi:hypothetical protein